MKKINKVIFALALLVVVFVFHSISVARKQTAINIGNYMPYGEIPSNYTLENAKSDRLVVYENGSITAGQAEWDEFISHTENGTPCMVRLAFYYTLDDSTHYSPEHYEEIKDNYPCLYIQDLTYNGKTYALYFTEDEKKYIYERKYLKRFDETEPTETSLVVPGIYYYLVNDNEVSCEQIIKSMFGSSDPSIFIECKKVYSKYACKDQ